MFIDVSKNMQDPILIDAERLTAIKVLSNGAIYFYNKKGRSLSIEGKEQGVDIQHVIKTLADHGFPVLPPVKWVIAAFI